jgi:undecaprenyl-diphosphatase
LVVLALGIVQGLTEFLPVSSSGHLVVAQHYLPGFTDSPLPFDIILHVGTLVSLVIYFYRDIWDILVSFIRWEGEERKKHRRLGLMVLVGSIPAGFLGILFGDLFESLFANVLIVPFMFLVSASILLVGERRGALEHGRDDVSIKEALIIGLMQGFAIVPGISRSGSTIATGLFMGLERETAARFSFLLSIPAILGAFLIKILFNSEALEGIDSSYVVGAAISALVGLVAIKLTINAVVVKKLWVFSIYLFLVGVVFIVLNIVS